MKINTLKQRILLAFAGIIVFLGICILALGYYVIKKDIIERAQVRVVRSLDSARTFYEEEINRIGESLKIADLNKDPAVLKNQLRLDYFYKIPVAGALACPSEIVRTAAEKDRQAGGTRIIPKAELDAMNGGIRRRTAIQIEPTPKARPTDMTILESVMSKEVALPIHDSSGKMTAIVYAGRIVNRDYVLVDRIRKLVFGDEMYNGKPFGTVTIFQGDVRISTNVLNENGQRAVGTRVSAQVYDAVVEEGHRWLDRAFVVTHWYKTAYEPIRNIDGDIIGMLYVGILEEPYSVMATRSLLGVLAVIVSASIIAFIAAVLLAGSVLSPVTELLGATRKMSDGQLGLAVPPGHIYELNKLSQSFNEMSRKLKEREASLKLSNDKLAELNKSYLDLLGFVAHELKGLLSSTVINAYSLRDGFLGMINFKQKKAVDSICRHLDYLDATVKKFLNLSRLERGNLEINKTAFAVGDVFDLSVQTFAQLAKSRNMQVENTVAADLIIKADIDLMQIVANNLVNNAIKYGTETGRIRISARDKGAFVTVEVYNDSTPIPDDKIDQLFRKFSRLDTPEKKKVKGTGLGLYITKQIVEAHGGHIFVEARKNGNAFIFTIHKE